MMGYGIVSLIVIGLVFFSWQGVSKWHGSLKTPVETGYVLVTEKNKLVDSGETSYQLTVQRGDKEWQLTVPKQVFFHVEPPVRKKLLMKNGEFLRFEE